MKRIGVYAGSFDPITYGHIDVIKQAHRLFDEIHVMVGSNPDKKPMFTLEERLEFLRKHVDEQLYGIGWRPDPAVIVVGSFEGLLVDYCAEAGATAIIRGLRDHIDFAHESHLAALNCELSGGIRTVWFYPSQSVAHVSSTLVRTLIKHGREFQMYSPIVPPRREMATP